MNKKDIAVLIPVYRLDMNDFEFKSLKNNTAVLRDYTIIFVKPESLDISPLIGELGVGTSESFDDCNFVGIESYNKLVLREDFYRRFSGYKYVLICQTDVYIFKDELLQWCEKGYDYIGAPWPFLDGGDSNIFKKVLNRFKVLCFKMNLRKCHRLQVGNGGLSLRKTEKFIEITRKYKEHFAGLLEPAPKKKFYPEDLILLYELEHTPDRLYKPGFKEAMHFSIEENPKWVYETIGMELPFGCHAWFHPSYYWFWKNIIV